MIRLLLWGLVAWLLYRGLRSLGGTGAGAHRTGAGIGGGAAEDMVRCFACQLNLPKSEAIDLGGRWACCAEHARRAPPAAPR